MQNDGAPTQNDAPESHAPKPCRILGDARKSRQHVVFERCPERCPNDARPDGSRPAKSTWPKPVVVQRHAGLTYGPPHQPSTSHCQCTLSCPNYPAPANAGPALPSMLPRAPRCPCTPAKHLTPPAHIVRLGPHVKRKGNGAEPGFEPGTLRLLVARSNH